jgi:hypothetical protein
MTSTPFHTTGLVYDETRQKPGWYPARIIGLKARRSRHGNPMPTVEFETPATGHIYPLWCPLPPETAKSYADDLEKFNQVARACDMPALTWHEVVNTMPVQRMLGCTVAVRLESEHHQGKWRSVIKEVRPLFDFKVRITFPTPAELDGVSA